MRVWDRFLIQSFTILGDAENISTPETSSETYGLILMHESLSHTDKETGDGNFLINMKASHHAKSWDDLYKILLEPTFL